MKFNNNGIDIKTGLLEVRYPIYFEDGELFQINKMIYSSPLALNAYEMLNEGEGLVTFLKPDIIDEIDNKLCEQEKVLNSENIENEDGENIDFDDIILAIEEDTENTQRIKPLNRTLETTHILNVHNEDIRDCALGEMGYIQAEKSCIYILRPFFLKTNSDISIMVNVTIELFVNKFAVVIFRIPINNMIIDGFPLGLSCLFKEVKLPSVMMQGAMTYVDINEFETNPYSDIIDVILLKYLETIKNKKNKISLGASSFQHLILLDYEMDKKLKGISKYTYDNLEIMFEASGGCVSIIRDRKVYEENLIYNNIDELNELQIMLTSTTLLDRTIMIILLEYCNSKVAYWRNCNLIKKDMKIAKEIMFENIKTINMIIEMQENCKAYGKVLLDKLHEEMPLFYREDLFKDKMINIEKLISADQEVIREKRQIIGSIGACLLTIIIGLPMIHESVKLIVNLFNINCNSNLCSSFSFVMWLLAILIVVVLTFGEKTIIAVKRIIAKNKLRNNK